MAAATHWEDEIAAEEPQDLIHLVVGEDGIEKVVELDEVQITHLCSEVVVFPCQHRTVDV